MSYTCLPWCRRRERRSGRRQERHPQTVSYMHNISTLLSLFTLKYTKKHQTVVVVKQQPEEETAKLYSLFA